MLLRHVYFIVFLYFLIGAISIFFINKKSKDVKKGNERWVKYGVYFVIVNVIINASWHNDNKLKLIAFAILVLGFSEILYVWANQNERRISQLLSGIAVLSFTGYGFWRYSFVEPSERRLYVYLLVFVFDGFCQICGQLFGRRKLSPRISPNKTIEGLTGGFIMTVLTSIAFRNDFDLNLAQSVLISSMLCLAALVGDLTASYYKRVCKVKDYSKLIPGHGGVLDRFDSYILAGAAFYLIACLHLFHT